MCMSTYMCVLEACNRTSDVPWAPLVMLTCMSSCVLGRHRRHAYYQSRSGSQLAFWSLNCVLAPW